MKRYYTRTFIGMGMVLAALMAAAVLANSFAGDARGRFQLLMAQNSAGRLDRGVQRAKVESLAHAIVPVRQFTAAWKNLARLPEKDAAEKIRSDIESIAQRQLGLVTDGAITPQPDRYHFQGLPMRVQRVSLRASGKDLTALMTWLGKVEEKYPAAIIELCEFSSNVGGNTGLTIRLVQPLQESSSHRAVAPFALQDANMSPDAIAALGWSLYLPTRVKASVAVGFQRNPLQPAVLGDPRPAAIVRDESDEITPRLESALDGRVRSVIRGPSPIVVVDGRVFRVGDELVIGRGRDKPVPEARTKLKEIDEDRLIFHVAGGTVERPIQCDIAYALPPFLKAR